MALLTVDAHLKQAPQSLGQPDLRLRLGSSLLFPIHKALVGGKASVLADLFAAYEGKKELCLWDGGGDGGDSKSGAAGQLPETVSNVEHFGLFLRQLYGCNPGISSEQQALALIDQADFWGCPSAIQPAEAYLSLTVLNGQAGLHSVHNRCQYGSDKVVSINGSKLCRFLDLASKHKLRRLMATCLPLLSGCQPYTGIFSKLDATVLQVVLTETFANLMDQSERGSCLDYGCQQKKTFLALCDGRCCSRCAEQYEMTWRHAAERMELALAERDWGNN